MLKLIYASLLLLFSSAAFLFSKEKDEAPCKQSLTGVVKEMKDESGFYLYIETADHQKYFPYIENEDVVLSSGSNIRVCYETAGVFQNSPRIKINHVSYLP
jgi:hypothetical protein